MIAYKNPHYFRFWCHKVLPLVYDNSLSYYELLCKVVKYLNDLIEDSDAMKANIDELKKAFDALKFYVDNYFKNLDIQDEVNAYFDSLKESGELEAILTAAAQHMLVDTSYFTPFAQVLPTANREFNSGRYAQGFAIGEDDKGRPVCLSCFTDATETGAGNVFSLDYMDTGVNISKKTVPSGHCNSATWNATTKKFYIATSGGSATTTYILSYDLEGNYNIEHDYPGGVWCIAWNRDKFFIGANGSLIVTDNNFNTLNILSIKFDSGYTYQGMGADDNYLYFPNGNGRFHTTERENVNRISVYTHGGTLVKNIDCMNWNEIEELAFYNGECYMNCNTQESSFIFKCNIKATETPYPCGHAYIPSINLNTQTIHVDETYNGFFIDGSEKHPVSSLYWWYMIVQPGSSRVNIALLSDCPEHVFAFWNNCPYEVTLYGNGHKIARVNWTGSNYLGLTDVTIIGTDNAVSCHVTATRFICTKLVFGEENSSIHPSRLLEVIGAPIEIISTTINQRADATWYLIGSGYIRGVTVNTEELDGVFLGGVFDVDGTFPIDKLQNASVYGISYKVVIYLNHNINVRGLFFPCQLDVPQGMHTISGLPDGVASRDVVAIDVDGVAVNKAIVHIYTSSGADYTIYNHK